MLTPRQVAERLDLRPSTLRKHALTFEAVTGRALPRGEYGERLWSAADVALLAEGLALLQRREADSLEGALRTLSTPIAPPLEPVPDAAETLRALIRDELRAVLREERAALPSTTSPDLAALREAVRAELQAERERDRVRALAVRPYRPRGLLARLLDALLNR